MLVKDKIRKLRIGQKTLIYRKEKENFWFFCPQNIQFYEFNKDAFAILLCISRKKFNPGLIGKIKKSTLAQKFLLYLIENELVTRKYLRKLNLLSGRKNFYGIN